ncbi:MAG: adenylate/guanylate cyclase domain-containing protein [Acidobacteria bacterium]|nr:adenylate/guanylate cyclase domain-containing protein [Acidobacteriota bacterium]
MPPSTSTDAALIRSAMGAELLRSERARVRLQLALLTAVLALLLLVHFVPQISSPQIRALLQPAFLPFGIILASYLAYEILILVWLGRLLACRRLIPRWFQFLNTFIEVSLPTLGLVTGGAIADPLSILSGSLPFLYFLFILPSALNLDAALCCFSGAVACLQFWAASFYLLAGTSLPAGVDAPILSMLTSPHQYLSKGATLLLGGLIAAFVATQIRRQIARALETLEERDRAVSIFGQHVSPQVADLLLKQPLDYAGQQRNVCVLFLDIRDFSKLSSERSAPEVVEYLNRLFAPMIPVINAHSGIVNKFLGDGFMAVFGAPIDDSQLCTNAIRAALEILRQVELLNQSGAIPHTRVGIGLHVGQAVTGNVGSSQRKEYTIIGDVVNLASRIEQANKPLNAQLLVSEAVVLALGNQFDVPAEDMGPVELKGQPHPVRLFKFA